MRGALKCWRPALASIFLSFFAIGSEDSALAGSVFVTDTWAGDANGLALPEGTLVFLDYNRYIHNDVFNVAPNSIFTKTLGLTPRDLPASGESYFGITRFDYFAATLWGRPLVLEFAFAYDAIQNLNIGNFPVPTNGLGPQPVSNGLYNPTAFFTYGLIVEPKEERFLGFSSYFFLPVGTFDKFKVGNFADPHMFTWVPQFEYAEGLEKVSPYLKGFWLDVIALAAVHSNGDSPFAIANVGQFDKTTQDTSYNIKAFLSYYYTEGGYFAVGIEKSWGGDQIMSGGKLGQIFGPTLELREDFLKGHLEAVFVVRPDIHLSFEVTHDFDGQGGFQFREDFTAEVRFTKFFTPAQQPLK
jgi:hypothetical protein